MERVVLTTDDYWDVKSKVSENDNFWENKPTTESVNLLRHILNDNYNVAYTRDSNGIVVFEIPENNIKFNLLAPSGLTNRKGETYVIGDIILLITIKREEYTYTFVTKQGFKYINVLERDRIKSILEEPVAATELLDAKVQYEAINNNESAIIPGTAPQQQTHSRVPKINVKDVIEGAFARIDKSIETLAGINQEIDPLQHKNVLHEYRTHVVVAANIIEKPIRTRNTAITVHGEGFERILQKADCLAVSKRDSSSIKVKEPRTAVKLVTTQAKYRVVDEICYKYRQKPIIIVPSGTMSIVVKSNIRQLLEQHQFIDPQEALKTGGPLNSSHPMNAIEIVHNIANKPVKFRVVENSYISKFTSTDWISVVCVILNIKGKRWQFQGYPFESFVDLFLTIKGVLFAYDADTIPSEMGTWDIKVLRISRSHRHHDAAISGEFWQCIDDFMLQRRQRKIHQTKKL
ncbi:bifunctional Cell division control protein 73 [Babesia duncani]|uniref:Bifunctional Cell division control protein 73 n=1 Tax=Babesia duncani TaxID=323732 RepID=A0AAD9PPG3_9APIC|nr:bifunctional Cell division control protein 73 [Babesia duncani]